MRERKREARGKCYVRRKTSVTQERGRSKEIRTENGERKR